MSFNLNSFRGSLNRHGGPANDNKFEVIITPPLSLFPTNPITFDLRFFCDSVQIPGVNFQATDNQRQGYGFTQKSATGISFDPITATFIVDSRHKVTRFFRSWQQKIINYDGTNPSVEYDGAYPFEFNYKDDYTGMVIILVYGAQDDSLSFSYVLKDAWPSDVGATQLGWNNNNSFLKQNVTFQYSSITHDGMRNHLGPLGKYRDFYNLAKDYVDLIDR